SDALYNIGRWIMSVSESNNRWLQEKLLLLLTPILAILNQTAEVDQKLLGQVRTALKLGEVDLTHTVAPEKEPIMEKASIIYMGDALRKRITSSYSKIQENK